MELQESREYKAAKELERALNDMSWNPQKFAESTRYYHRTLQQELMKTIVAIIKMVGDKGYRTDLRNQGSHELCRKIIDSGVLEINFVIIINLVFTTYVCKNRTFLNPKEAVCGAHHLAASGGRHILHADTAH